MSPKAFKWSKLIDQCGDGRVPQSLSRERRPLERGFCHHQPAHPEFKAGKVGGTVFVLIDERRRWLCLVKAFLIGLNKQMIHFGSFLIEGKKKKIVSL